MILGTEAAGFNPRPTRRPGTTHWRQHVEHTLPEVSILARPEGRALPWVNTSLGETFEVSILARPEGRALPMNRLKMLGGYEVSILARPEGRALRTYR